jgi:RimJ/RimL family protein N-acetyltransferase
MSPASPNDLELLGIQREGSLDHRGRVAGWYGVSIACAERGQALSIGAEVPDALAAELAAAFDRAPHSSSPSEPPPALELCRRILAVGDPSLASSAGPSFLIEAETPLASGAHVERSDASSGEALRNSNPGNWQPIEWNELLDGRLGPWTIAIEGALVVSICHTPRPVTARAAECGVWTHPAFRGRGHAAAVTSEWARVMRPSGRYLFYSTDAENRSSQRVAERLHLRPLGWTWRLGRAREHDGAGVHPLSSLYPASRGPTCTTV